MRANLRGRAAHSRLFYAGCISPRRRLVSSSAARPAGRAPADASDGEARLVEKTRNIGIIAHIDAGKTTTTERMLYYSGYTRRIGEVDEGSTVTDFLPAERARGITIQSAAITFHWPPGSRPEACYNISLIDTPGHADFTFEVLRSLRVLDGAICVLDGVAGVEAQTEKVWTQASHYRIPRIIYVNKLDREGAAFGRTVKEIAVRLRGWPAVCQVPWWTDNQTRLAGIGDVVGLKGLWWEQGGDGQEFQIATFEELKRRDEAFAAELSRARVALVELISEHDEELVERFLEHDEDHLAIPTQDLTAALRRCVLRLPQTVFPVFAGASFRNIGVQPLLDAVVALLPSPLDRPSPEITLGTIKGSLRDLVDGSLLPETLQTSIRPFKAVSQPSKQSLALQNLKACALAFKVVHDARRGSLVYVRVYSGIINRNALLYNTNLGNTERAQRLFQMYASEPIEVSAIQTGQIGVIPGLKHARTGDTLLVCSGPRAKDGPPEPLNSLQLKPIEVPPPVFFTSVQANSLSDEKHLNESLSLILREDPSLSVSIDAETGQTHLSGMGELHLEIARDRLLSDFKANGIIGNIEIGYREGVLGSSGPITELFDREIAGRRARASSTVAIEPRTESTVLHEEPHTMLVEMEGSNVLTIEHRTVTRNGKPASERDNALPTQFSMTAVLNAVQTGVAGALSRGPKYSFPVHSALVKVEFNPDSQIYPDTTLAALSTAVRLATTAALRSASGQAGSMLMEPVMLVTISVGEEDLGAVSHDLSAARGGQVISLDASPAESTGNTSIFTPSHTDDELSRIDSCKIYVPPDPFMSRSNSGYRNHDLDARYPRQRHVVARVPLKEMAGYLNCLRSLTGGRGSFVMKVDRFEKMGGQRMKQVLGELQR